MARPEEILHRLEKEPYLAVEEEEWEAILAGAEVLRTEKPVLAEEIRVLRIDGATVVQETSEKKEILLRRFAGEKEADAFVRGRIELYDRMWDGCGCRVNFYE